ncbi:hypothetical protein EGW08_005845 [Elysia chlorotica]|uniref:GOLD domain-containing protein n=1 Tax=Elysia chlorotica TaxID=188477 RepID=A0A3S0ZYT9_ELYCH|nr:hypothetical protein EGW08_005845 [Elysia chlorotica]
MDRRYPALLCLFGLLSVVLSTEIDLTVDIPAGRQECFWQEIPASTTCEVDYQVIDGGDMDISVYVAGPEGRVIYMDQRKTENVIRFTAEGKGDYKICFDNSFSTFSNKVVFFEMFIEDDRGEGSIFVSFFLNSVNIYSNCKTFTAEGKGDYKICFDNSFSTFSNKVVFFEMFIEDDRGEGDDDDDEEHKLAMKEDYKGMESQLDMTVEQFLGILDRSKKNLERSVQVQTLIRMHEAKDRNTQEANFFRVNFFSCFQLAVMMVVGLGQVIMIRGLFQDRRSVSGAALKART